jgi:hypothetical protein
LAVGIVASFFIGDLAASDTSTPKTWVAILDLILGAMLLIYVVLFLRRPPDPARVQSMIEKMGKLATAPVLAIVGAGAALANPGGFIPIALKDISELNPSTIQYAVDWLFWSGMREQSQRRSSCSWLPLSFETASPGSPPEASGSSPHPFWMMCRARRFRTIAGDVQLASFSRE